jgi:hypothetical protein
MKTIFTILGIAGIVLLVWLCLALAAVAMGGG